MPKSVWYVIIRRWIQYCPLTYVLVYLWFIDWAIERRQKSDRGSGHCQPWICQENWTKTREWGERTGPLNYSHSTACFSSTGLREYIYMMYLGSVGTECSITPRTRCLKTNRDETKRPGPTTGSLVVLVSFSKSSWYFLIRVIDVRMKPIWRWKMKCIFYNERCA